jgi:hypothetical protein
MPPDQGETKYGIFRTDYSRKPAADVFRDQYPAKRLW